MLDNAKNVPDAFELFGQYNIDIEGGPPFHCLLSDAPGSSTLPEYYQGELIVIPNEEPWQGATNFLYAAVIDDPKGQCWRFDTIEEVLDDNDGLLTVAHALSLLEEVSQPGNQWSIFCDNSDLDLTVALDKN